MLDDADRYLLALVKYIHRNPVRAGMVDDVGDYEWSSHRANVSTAKKWNWLHADFVSMHGIRRSLLEKQVASLGFDLQTIMFGATLNYSKTSGVTICFKRH